MARRPVRGLAAPRAERPHPAEAGIAQALPDRLRPWPTPAGPDQHRAINAYVEWRQTMGAISFSTRKDGQRPRADELVIPNAHGLPYIRLDDGPMKGGSAGIWSRLREVAGVEGVAMRDIRHYFAVSCLSREQHLHLLPPISEFAK